MEILVRNQNRAVFLSVLLGLIIGVIYDAFKLVRKLVIPQKTPKRLFNKGNRYIYAQDDKTPKKSLIIRDLVVVALFDLSFCLLLCPIFCVFTYITVNGRFRWFIFAAAFFGALLYKGTLGRPVGAIIDCLSYYIYRFRRFIFDKIKGPLKKLSGKIKSKRNLKRKNREEKNRKKKRTVVFSYGDLRPTEFK